MLYLVAFFIGGVIFGSIITRLIFRIGISGNLIVTDEEDEPLPNLRVEFIEHPEIMRKRQIVKFRVKNKSYYEWIFIEGRLKNEW